MARMVRKQLYLEPRQERTLKRLARARGVTEAEVVRAAIDELDAGHAGMRPEEQAWQRALGLMNSLLAKGALPAADRGWTREDLYRDRLDRYDRHSD